MTENHQSLMQLALTLARLGEVEFGEVLNTAFLIKRSDARDDAAQSTPTLLTSESILFSSGQLGKAGYMDQNSARGEVSQIVQDENQSYCEEPEFDIGLRPCAMCEYCETSVFSHLKDGTCSICGEKVDETKV